MSIVLCCLCVSLPAFGDASPAAGPGDERAPSELEAISKDDLPQRLFIAVRDEDIASIRQLIAEGADVNALLYQGSWTPLLLAVRKNRMDMADLFLSSGADVNGRNRDGLSPLQEAVLGGQRGMIELLIASGADLNARDKAGLTPLHAAVKGDRADLVELLISKGADLNIADNDGKTLLQWTEMGGHEALAKRLRRHGALDGERKGPIWIGLGKTEIYLLLGLVGFAIWLAAFAAVWRGNFEGRGKRTWLLIVILLPVLIGPLCYFFIGRKRKLPGMEK